mgnify:FL=1
MRDRKKKGIGLILIGIAIFAVPFFLRISEQNRTDQYLENFKEDEDESEETAGGKKKETILSDEGVIGIIEIPELDLKYPVFEGAGVAQLNEGIGHMTNTSGLCEEGNCVLAGHNGSRRGIYFTYLCNVKSGEVVKLTNKKGEMHEYTVAETRVVNPYDSWVTEEREEEVLTWFTCASHGTRRFVCRCLPAGGDE